MDFSIGASPRGVAIGDLNGDGLGDVVAGEWSTFTAARFLANGAGGLGPKADLGVGNSPFAIALGDLDGNGTLDIATANANSNTVSILLGDGTGQFPSRTDYPTGAEPLAVAIADFNGDGIPDVITANASGSVSVFLGTGAGHFGAAKPHGVQGVPYAMAVGDLNLDGKPDVVVADYNGGVVPVLLGDGSGGFTMAGTFGVGGSPTSVAIGDLDGDGIPDIVSANQGSGSISVLHGLGNGSFASRVDYPTGYAPTSVAIADLNLDGRADLAETSNGSNAVGVYLGVPGGFAPRLDFPTGNNPWWVAIGKLNGDPYPDLVVTNMNDGTVSVLIQRSIAGTPTTTILASDLNPSNVGDTVTLTASVSPAVATGLVEFFDGGKSLGVEPLGAGVASLSTAGLARGTHNLTAVYGGDPTYLPSVSAAVSQVVHGQASVTAVTASVNPSEITQPVTFTASVSAATAGLPTPTGTVQFTIDDLLFGAPVTLVSGQAVSGTTTALAPGSHAVQALYLGDAYYDPSTSPTLAQVVEAPSPVIAGVRDVPNDQGGRVFLTWRCKVDQPGLKVVTGYRVWRRAPSPTAAARARGRAAPGRTLDETFWEAIATLPSEQLVSYAFTAPTTQDSMLDSNPQTAFFVTALTQDPSVFYESAPDSGYSVDNLSPPAPASFTAVYGPITTSLHWGVSPAPDLHEFRLYRGLSADFVPGPSNLVVATRDTGYVDATRTPYAYKLNAVDIHGNTSRYALVTPGGPVAALVSVVSIAGSPDDVRVTWSSPANPGLSATVYRRSEATDWTAIAAVTADARGFLSYEDTQVTGGRVYGYRLGIMDGGAEVFVGEAWALADRLVFALEGVRPNPSVGSDLTVRFSLPSAAPARLELIDVGGRRLAAREVGDLGPGGHAVNLASGLRLAPGIYLVRLSQGGLVQVTRAAVIR